MPSAFRCEHTMNLLCLNLALVRQGKTYITQWKIYNKGRGRLATPSQRLIYLISIIFMVLLYLPASMR